MTSEISDAVQSCNRRTHRFDTMSRTGSSSSSIQTTDSSRPLGSSWSACVQERIQKELETLRESLSFHMRHDPSQDGLRVGLTNVFQLHSGKAASENKSATQCGLMHERITRTAIRNDKWNSMMVVASKVVTLFGRSICKRGRRDWILEGSRRETVCSWRIASAIAPLYH